MPRRVSCTSTYVGQTAVNFNIPKAEASIVGFILGPRRQDAAKTVNDVAIIAIDDVPI